MLTAAILMLVAHTLFHKKPLPGQGLQFVYSNKDLPSSFDPVVKRSQPGV